MKDLLSNSTTTKTEFPTFTCMAADYLPIALPVFPQSTSSRLYTLQPASSAELWHQIKTTVFIQDQHLHPPLIIIRKVDD
jgi:hypothetical protein